MFLTLVLTYAIIMGPMEKEFVNRSIEIRRLPVSTDYILNALAKLRGMTKTALIREALNEYVERHRGDVARLIKEER
jgi:Ribbon-helix-helix protein, copG family